MASSSPSPTCHCRGLPWCFCHTSGNTHTHIYILEHEPWPLLWNGYSCSLTCIQTHFLAVQNALDRCILFYFSDIVFSFFRPIAPASVVPAVTAFLNHLLCEIEAERLGKGLSFLLFLKTEDISVTPNLTNNYFDNWLIGQLIIIIIIIINQLIRFKIHIKKHSFPNLYSKNELTVQIHNSKNKVQKQVAAWT